MKKIIKIFILLGIGYFAFNLNVKAATATFKKGDLYNWNSSAMEVCDEKSGNKKIHNNEHHFDKLPKDSVSGYCLAPKQSNAFKNYKVVEVLDPTTSEFALAVYLAYNILTKDKYITQKKQVGQVVSPTLRLIASRYGKLSNKGTQHNDNSTNGYYTPYVLNKKHKVKNTDFFKGTYGKKALNIYNSVLQTMNELSGTVRQKFNTLANNGSISVAKWTATFLSQTQISGTQKRVTFSISSPNVPADNIKWDSFKCGTNCISLVKNSNGNFTATVSSSVNSFTVKTSQNTWKDYHGRIAILKHNQQPNSYQPMLVVDTRTHTTSTDVAVSTPGLPVIPPPDPCSYEKNPSTGERVYYDKSGKKTDATTYRSQCVKSCSKDDGLYICKSVDPDEDGSECSVQEYEEQCTFCGMYRQVCINNPNDPGCPSNYFEECPNCNPSVSMPASCSDFDVESTVTGEISDINQEKTTCNPSVKPVKGCVIGGKDLAGNLYEVADKLQNNRFCKVYCYEDYQFDMPTARRSTSGGYFNLAMQVTGIKNCYIGSENMLEDNSLSSNLQFDYSDFKETVESLNNEIKSYDERLNTSFGNIDSDYREQIDQLEEDYQKQFENLENEYNTQKDKLNDDFNTEKEKLLNDMTEENEEETQANIEKLENELNENLTNLENKYNEDREKLEKEKNDKETALTGGIESQKTDSEKQMEEYILETAKELKSIIDEYKECTTLSDKWNSDLNFDPTIKYEYQEYDDASNNYNEGTYKISGDVKTTYENTYCYSQTDNQYNCVDDKKIVTTGEGDQVPGQVTFSDNTSTYEPIKYYECEKNGTVDCIEVQDVVSTAIGVQKTVTKTATLAPSQSFNTYHQYGTVKTGSLCENANVEGYNNCLWTRLPDEALPVELKTGKGAFPFKLYVSNIGQYSNGDDSLGRLIGNSKSVLNEYNNLPSTQKCSAFDTKGNALVQESGYVCAYINNCDECSVNCDGDSCEMQTCDGCKVNCRTCIFDGNNNTYKYRTVSLNNLFPNKCIGDNTTDCREAGYNWNSKDAATNGASKKAAETIKEIEEKYGENALEEDKNYSYTLSPMQLKAIRDYNKEAGTYANTQMPHNEIFKNDDAALQCEQVTYDNGITYSVKCLSTFLNDTSGTYFTSNMQRSDTSKFTLWTDTDYCLNGSCLSKSDGVGPSWK